MPAMLTRCPVCEAGLEISELTCPRCETRIHGKFDSCRFCQIAPEHLAFIETFLRCEGNLSRVEKELNVSYPTVRNRLTAALLALDLDGNGARNETAERAAHASLASGPEAEARRRVILEALASGAMDAEAAAHALRDLT